VTQRAGPGLDPAIQERAGLTDRQAMYLELHVKGASYRWIARELGLTLEAIARRLNDEGMPTAQGGKRWYASTVRAVVR
jgi:DNA-binding NarL/FixJ family response regulator